jgi:hypothetical protein
MELHKDYTGTIEVKTINLLKDKTETLISTGTRNPILQTTACLNGIYMNQQCHNEIRGFDEVARFYTLNKLHKHSHLYTSVTLISFPGRIFEIENCIPYSKQELKTYLQKNKKRQTSQLEIFQTQ